MALRECGVLKVCVLVIGILSLVSCAANSKNNDLSHSQAQAFPEMSKKHGLKRASILVLKT
jgi:hypothetical protein